jgi:cytochrome c oxidase subunit 2
MSHQASHSSDGTQVRAFDTTSKLAVILIGAIAAIAGIVMGVANPFLNNAVSSQGMMIDTLFSVLLGIATAVFVLVQGLLLYSIVRFARTPDDESDGMPIRGNTKLEILWTAIPAIIVVGISIYSYRILVDIDRPQPDHIKVDVTGRQFSWEYYYPDYDIKTSELHIPLGRQARLRLTSADVNHAFWVPQMRMKKDAIGGKITETSLTGTELGTYPVVCAELCGAGHALMRSQVVVDSGPDFQNWIQSQIGAKQRGASAAADPVAYGRQLFNQFGCNACHKLADAGAVGAVGPSLDGVGSRAANTVPGQSAEEYLRNAIVKPGAYIVPNFQPVMPSDYGQRMSDQEVDAMVKYLLGQK